jgi:hypothetical protein
VATQDRLPSLPGDVADLERIVEALGAAMVVVDPLMAYLGSHVNSNHMQDIRLAFAPLAAMAERCGPAVVMVNHLNKAAGGAAIYRGGGSIGINGAARSVLVVAKDPDAEEDDLNPRSIMSPVKNNLAPNALSMAYRLRTSEEFDCATISWEGTTGHTATGILAVPSRERDPDNGALGRAQSFLATMLSAGPVPVDAIKKAADGNGITWATVRRAKDAIGIDAKRLSVGFGGDGHWEWSLPQGAQRPTRRSSPEGEHLARDMSALRETEPLWDEDLAERATDDDAEFE